MLRIEPIDLTKIFMNKYNKKIEAADKDQQNPAIK